MDVSSTAANPEDLQNPSPLISSKADDLSPKPQIQTNTTRSEHLSNPYPTTFVQADTSTFKHVVQMLTGSSETTTKQDSPQPQQPVNTKGGFSIPPIKKTNSFKLYERRQNNNNGNNMFVKNNLMINTLRINNGGAQRFMFSGGNSHVSPRFSPRNSEILLSPSMLEFPKLGLNSPVTPLNNNNNDDPFNKSSPLSLGNSSSCSCSSSELLEEKAIAEKGFYLHPSPISTPRDSEPQLLPLFPVTSPKLSSSGSSSQFC